MSDTKQCSVCGTTKPLTEFFLTKPGGKPRAHCKDCHRADIRKRNPDYQRTHPEGTKAKIQRWQKKNPEKVRKYSRNGMRRLRRKKRDRGQTFLSLDTPPPNPRKPKPPQS